ncbi:MAG: Eco57I restriction-modification methylase domain-containing protein [Coriobacteriia bacterium]|nr:Eco57I restriction-modification methylase domain-containing protein [Coriobacteriia bacterium]
MKASTLNVKTQAVSQSASSNKTKYAQYFTPLAVAKFMVGMFTENSVNKVTVLDPGAGEGILGLSLTEHLTQQGFQASTTFVEIDELVFNSLKRNVQRSLTNFKTSLINDDFIAEGTKMLNAGEQFSHIIMNPPYFKLQREGDVSTYLLSCGINVTNIYAAFMWLGLRLLDDQGQMVAIVPRSFCNGPYFIKFREYLVEHASIEAIHTFGSRDKVFSTDKVLQENIIIHISKRAQSNQVRITCSEDQQFINIEEALFSADEVIDKTNPNLTISIPANKPTAKLTDFAKFTLADTGLQVSTGPVVDFRLKEFISNEDGEYSVPLLYPSHMKEGHIVWPVDNFTKKGQYYSVQPSLLDNVDANSCSDKNVSLANGYYVVIRRFSSKEEHRRIYAAVVDPAIHEIGVAFENHLNYFHKKKQGFEKELAYGLSAYLNSALVDDHFRSFSGHTQVNATDLRNLPYPSEQQLIRIGRAAIENAKPIDEVVCDDSYWDRV